MPMPSLVVDSPLRIYRIIWFTSGVVVPPACRETEPKEKDGLRERTIQRGLVTLVTWTRDHIQWISQREPSGLTDVLVTAEALLPQPGSSL